jgi:signal-transduction protein with cAMP-binding, CBS, and nucleotidyltransferase domain
MIEVATEMVSRFMRQPVFSVGAGASVEQAMALAQENRIHHIPIVQSGKLLGLVCVCDLKEVNPNVRVLQLARRNVITAPPDCSAVDVARLMMTNAVGSVVICNRDGVWGIVTRKDLAETGPDLAALLAEDVCAACGAREHLRLGPEDTFLCAECATRASTCHWYDETAATDGG